MLGLLLAQSNVLGDLQLGSHWHTDNTGRRYSGPFSASNGHCVGRLQAGLTGNQLGNRCAVVGALTTCAAALTAMSPRLTALISSGEPLRSTAMACFMVLT